MLWLMFALLPVCVMAAQDMFCAKAPVSDLDENNCKLAGNWKNELGSVMTINQCIDGQLEGTYTSYVGVAKYNYNLTGRYTMTGSDAELGWVVSWNNDDFGNSNSATSWSGIYYDKDGTIYTQWLLTRYVERASLWSGTNINHDTFIRTCLDDGE